MSTYIVQLPSPVKLLTSEGKPVESPDRDAPEEEKKYQASPNGMIQVAPLKEDRPWDLLRVLDQWIFGDSKGMFFNKKFGNRIASWNAQKRIDDAIRKAQKDGDHSFEILGDDLKRIKEAIESWMGSEEKDRNDKTAIVWNDGWMVQLLAMFQCWFDAKEKEPSC